MAVDDIDPTLKFPAGRFEDSLLALIIVLQMSIGITTIVVGFFWAHVVADQSVRTEFSFYPEILVLAFGMAAFTYLLNRLYEIA